MCIKPQVISIAVAFLGFLTSVYNEEIKCDAELSVDITDGVHYNGQITKNGITYNEENYYQDNGRVYGCPCNIQNCLRKCCAETEALSNKTCQPYMYDVSSHFQRHLPEEVSINQYYIIHDIVNCTDKVRFILDPSESNQDNFVLTKNGNLIWQSYNFSVNDYCLEYLVEDTTFAALLCSDVEENVSHAIGTNVFHSLLLV